MEDETGTLTVEEFAKRKGITSHAVQAALSTGRIHGTHFGRRWQIPISELEHYRPRKKKDAEG